MKWEHSGSELWVSLTSQNTLTALHHIQIALQTAHSIKVQHIRIYSHSPSPPSPLQTTLLFSTLRTHPLSPLLTQFHLHLHHPIAPLSTQLLLTQLSHCYLISTLRVVGCGLSPSQMQMLGETRWRFVVRLELGRNDIGWEGVGQLRKGQWPWLKELGLEHNPIGNRGAQELAKLPADRLKTLLLEDTQLTGRALSPLTKSQWPSLSLIDLRSNSIGQEVYLLFQGCFPCLTCIAIGPSTAPSTPATTDYLCYHNFAKFSYPSQREMQLLGEEEGRELTSYKARRNLHLYYEFLF